MTHFRKKLKWHEYPIPSDQIKTTISLQRLVEASGVKLNNHGPDLIGLCPFHDDKTPSLVVTPAKNLWHCLGACQQGGSVIDWVIKQKNISFRHAVELLRLDLSPLAASLPTPVDEVTLPPIFKAGEGEATLKRVVQFYHATLKASPEALDYLCNAITCGHISKACAPEGELGLVISVGRISPLGPAHSKNHSK